MQDGVLHGGEGEYRRGDVYMYTARKQGSNESTVGDSEVVGGHVRSRVLGMTMRLRLAS